MKAVLILFFCGFVCDGVYGRKFSNTAPTTRLPRVTIAFEKQIISKTCYLKPSPGPCRGHIDMYYFDPSEKKCGIFQWGGCQGNGNRFDSEGECESTCLSRPGDYRKPRYCALSFDYGYCFGAVSRYYYDAKWQVCKETMYSGCGGNKNNFFNLEQCESICRFNLGPLPLKTRAPGSREVLIINPTTQKTRYQSSGANQPVSTKCT